MRFLRPNMTDESVGLAFLGVGRHIEQRLEAAVADLTTKLESRVAANVSGGVLKPRSGDLFQSLQAKTWTRPGVKVGGLVSSRQRKAPYGRFQEYGFMHVGQGGKRVQNSFMQPALDGMRTEVRTRLQEVIRSAAREV